MVNMWWRPNGKRRRSKVPNKNGANTGAVDCELAIQTPNPLIPDWTTGHKADKTKAVSAERTITTNGTKRFPLKKERASGSLR